MVKVQAVPGPNPGQSPGLDPGHVPGLVSCLRF